MQEMQLPQRIIPDLFWIFIIEVKFKTWIDLGVLANSNSAQFKECDLRDKKAKCLTLCKIFYIHEICMITLVQAEYPT